MKTLIFAVIILMGIFFGHNRLHGMEKEKDDTPSLKATKTQSAVFAGGCFWCTESDFEKVPGVTEVISGYTGGHVENPTYEEVSSGVTGHVESVKVVYDPAKVTYEQLLDYFWRHVNPTDAGGQFVDRGPQYRSVIFYEDEHQRQLAEASKEKLAKYGPFKEPIATEILPLGPFYAAEEYHQDYYKKNPIRYHYYRFASGRDQFIEKAWKTESSENLSKLEGNAMASDTAPAMSKEVTEKNRYTIPGKEELRQRLTPMQYEVTQENGTEPAFDNVYWNNHEAGIYVDIVSGEPLFSSTDKFDSGTGWPSFTRPLAHENIVEKTDKGFFMTRTEVRSKHANSHLGHVFDDGPPPTGLRYCMNSAALRFIPKADLEKDGYGKYLQLFQ